MIDKAVQEYPKYRYEKFILDETPIILYKISFLRKEGMPVIILLLLLV